MDLVLLLLKNQKHYQMVFSILILEQMQMNLVPFVPGQYYFAPEGIKVQRNYLIIWNQSDSSNVPQKHILKVMRCSSAPLQMVFIIYQYNLYYNSTGVSQAPAADYENEFAPIFLMNADENGFIYYFCKHHPDMSGKEGHEGYMIFILRSKLNPIQIITT